MTIASLRKRPRRPGRSLLLVLAALAVAAGPTRVAGASGAPHAKRPGYVFYEDEREGFPKIAAYRPGCSVAAAKLAAFDWVVTSGTCAAALDRAHGRNPSLLGMIQPGRRDELFAASYGQYDQIASPLSHPAIGSIRAFQSSDWLHNTDGSVHQMGSVNVLNLLSTDTALWSADVAAYWARRNGALSRRHPGVMGIWGDNDFWSDQAYAFVGTPLDPNAAGAAVASANQATWDTNFVARHNRLARDLPGMVIGGNDLASYSAHPAAYKGGVANGWLLPGISSAGMRECADRYSGLFEASGVDKLITAAQRYLAGKKLDGKQRYLMLNNCDATSMQTNEYSLAVATIGGFYYWPYTQSGWWGSTIALAPAIPGYIRNGTRHWLGLPTAAPKRLASGLWKRTFQHGVVYVNMTGATQTVDGRTLDNQAGLFVGRSRTSK